MLNLFYASEAIIGGYRFVIDGFIPHPGTSFTIVGFKCCIHHFGLKQSSQFNVILYHLWYLYMIGIYK
jgi:hypothetical protein